MIPTLLITILVEGIVVGTYSVWRKKPVVFILLSSILANLITQAFLWAMLNYFYQRYLMTLLVAEILIWLLESLLLYGARVNQLGFRESLGLSFGMNLASFTIGWWLPV